MMLRSSHRLMIMFRSLRYQHSYRVHPMVVKKHGADQGPTSGSTKPVSNAFLSPVFNRASSFKDKVALKDRYGQYTYGRLFNASYVLAKQYEEKIGEKQQQKIAFLCPNDASYLLTQWACWMAGHIAVPLSPLHPAAMLEYFIHDAEANLIVTTTEFQEIVEKVGRKTGCSHLILDSRIRDKALTTTVYGVTNDNAKNKLLNSSDIWNSDNKPSESISEGSKIENLRSSDSGNLLSAKVLNKKTEELFISKLPESFYKTSNAMIIYTSGSTGQPKGVLISHQNLDAQINSMVKAWQWTSNDSILHTLPLHHIHGIVNGLLCPLAVGARCVMLPSFDASEVWKQLLGVKMPECERVNMFMGVPTMYAKLVDKYMQSLTKNERMIDYVRASCSQKIRLFVSGSAPLPTQVFEKWEFITGHKILERYGMSETGMVLTNPLDGERNPGAVGNPFPGVEVRIVDNKNNVLVKGSSVGTQVIAKGNETLSGELQVKGSNVFKGYYHKPEQTAETFADGWFKTGDYAQYSDKSYKILGRQSVDIIKTGGYKVSAVHVETALRDHPDIVDVAVVGISDITWGQKVAAVVETNKGEDLDLVKLKEWVKTKLPPYEVPTLFQIVKSIPRNTLGKVNKKELVNVVFPKNNKEI